MAPRGSVTKSLLLASNPRVAASAFLVTDAFSPTVNTVGPYPPVEELGVGLPGLVGALEIDNVGHWVQHEAAAEVNDQIVKFLRTVNPA